MHCRKGMKVSRSKTDYMGLNEKETGGLTLLQMRRWKKDKWIKYLRPAVKSDGDCGSEVKKRVQFGW